MPNKPIIDMTLEEIAEILENNDELSELILSVKACPKEQRKRAITMILEALAEKKTAATGS